MSKSSAGKGDGLRQGFDWKIYSRNYKAIFNPLCTACGNVMVQRTGWFGKYYCVNKGCKLFKVIIKRK